MGPTWVLSAQMGPMLGSWTCYRVCFLGAVLLLDIYEQNCDLISSRPSDIYYDITGSDNGWLIGSVVPRHYLDHYWPVVNNTSNFHAKIHLKILSAKFWPFCHDLSVLIECCLITRLPWVNIFLTSHCILKSPSYYTLKYFNTLRPRQNVRYLPDDIFKCIFWIKKKDFLI